MQSVRGMRDLFGEDAKLFDYLCVVAYDFAMRYGFESLHLPVIENLGLFVRNLGESTDVISKEIYSFDSRGGERLALRPEFTAGASRFFVEHGLYKKPMPQKFFSVGPLFRYDRPQKGRYRQFTQFNFEIFGSEDNSRYESFTLFFVVKFLEQFGVKIGEKWRLRINFLGDESMRELYKKALVGELSKHVDSLSEDSRNRLKANPLRILDSKDPKDIKILSHMPLISSFYTDDYKRHIDDVLGVFNTSHGDGFAIDFDVDHSLVRGLDYYDGLVFEVCQVDANVAQNSVLGGGKYARLVRDISNGVANVAAIGFAVGVDRLMEVCKENGLTPPSKKKIYLAGWREKMPDMLRFADALSADGKVVVEVALKDYGSSLGSENIGPEVLGKKHHKVCADALKRGFDVVASFFSDVPSYKLLNNSGGGWLSLDGDISVAAGTVSSVALQC